MDALAISAASGLRARMEALDLLANNLANAATSGYKLDREFYNLYLAPEAVNGAVQPPATLPVIERRWTDFTQGTLRATGNALDLALSGRGLFVVDGTSGPLYTRNGNFRLSTAGQLVTSEGYLVRTVSGRPVRAQPDKPVEVQADGSVVQDGAVLERLLLVDFPDATGLEKVGNSYFRAPSPEVKPVAAANVEVHRGKLESSNVNPAEAAVRLVGVMRQFEMLQKAIALSGEMNRKAIEEVARVGP